MLIPAELESLEKAGVVTENLPAMVRAGLERFRSAGIRLDVSYFDPQWVLDHSGLESLPPGPAMQLEAAVPALVRTTRRPPATRAPGRRARK